MPLVDYNFIMSGSAVILRRVPEEERSSALRYYYRNRDARCAYSRDYQKRAKKQEVKKVIFSEEKRAEKIDLTSDWEETRTFENPPSPADPRLEATPKSLQYYDDYRNKRTDLPLPNPAWLGNAQHAGASKRIGKLVDH